MSTTQIKGELPMFTHEKLPDDDSYIRLLTIVDIDETRLVPIHCKLTTWYAPEAPRYHAFSYAWGDATHTATILVNGRRMQVRRNCEYTLKQGAWHGGNSSCRPHYWIDAICIDQSNTEEKGPQVALMGQIYMRAEHVLACVGECDLTSEYLYSKACKRIDVLRELGGLSGVFDPEGAAAIAIGWEQGSVQALARLCHALGAFLRRPYFSRVWVFQELFLGRQVSVCCDNMHMSIRTFRGLAMVVYTCHKLLIENTGCVRDPIAWQHNITSMFHEEDAATIFEAVNSLLRVGALAPEPTTFSDASRHVADLKSADPRDKVYGILSVVDWSNKVPIRPDYTKDRLEVAIEAIQTMLTETVMSTKKGTRVSEPLALAAAMTKALDLYAHASPRLREAIERRRLLYLSEPSASINEHFDRIALDFWGSRVTCVNGGWELDTEPVISRPWLQHTVIPPQLQLGYWGVEEGTERDGSAIILPGLTRSGDWCLGSPERAFIARPRADGRFDIVGNALMDKKLRSDWSWGAQPFKVLLSVEDAIVLLSTSNWDDKPSVLSESVYGVPQGELMLGKVNEYLETRVCGQPGSSEAISCMIDDISGFSDAI